MASAASKIAVGSSTLGKFGALATAALSERG
jgi:hypothetical protein